MAFASIVCFCFLLDLCEKGQCTEASEARRKTDLVPILYR